MNRKLIGAAVAVVVILPIVWFLFLRGHKDKPADVADGKPRSADVKAGSATPQKQPEAEQANAPRGVAPRWSLDVDPEGPLVLEGQVVGPDGKGIGGAKVTLGSVPPRTATAEGDGTFSFDKLVGRTYHLGASSGKLTGSTTYKLTEKGDPVVIHMIEGASVEVTVIDDAAKPVAGADVKSDEEITAKTDDKGIARIEPVNPGWVMVHANAEGYAPASGFTTIGSSGGAGKISITLHKGFAISGKVIDEGGKAIAKAKIEVENGMWDYGRDPDAAVTSDDKGAFTIPAAAPGSHLLIANDNEHAPARSTPVTVKDRAITGVVITMKAGGNAAGHVVDKNRKPVAFATVRITGKGANAWMTRSRQATTDKDGAFELRGLARTKMQARAESDTAASKIVDIDLDAKADVTGLELVLDVSGTITGTVVDDKGRPVPEVTVNAFPDILGGANTESIALAGLSSASTDGGGGFTLHGLPDGKYRLWAARTSGGPQDWGQQGTAAKTGDSGVKIVLPAPGEMIGKIVLEGASTPPSATVQVGMQPGTPAKDGAFDLKDVNPGTYDVTIRGLEFAPFAKRDVKIEPGKVTDLGTITVLRGRKLSGKVTDKSGQPVAGAKVQAGDMLISSEGAEDQMAQFDDMRGIRSAVTDQSGEFTIVGLSNKPMNVMADSPDVGRSLAVAVPEGTDDPPPVSLQLRGFGSIAGKVTSQGKTLARVTITDSSKGGGAAATFAQTDDDGNFTLTRVPEGVHVLQAMQQQMMSMKSTTTTVTVTAGRQSTVTIDIPVGTITVTVTIKPLPNNQVDAAQVFLFQGNMNVTNGKDLTNAFLQGGGKGMKFWLGSAMPMPTFDELVAGDYSACVIPITGSMQDQTLMQRIQENVAILKVYCKPFKVTPSPAAQGVSVDVPAMVDLPK